MADSPHVVSKTVSILFIAGPLSLTSNCILLEVIYRVDVSRITIVNWTTHTFFSLIVNESMTELTLALVIRQIHANSSSHARGGK